MVFSLSYWAFKKTTCNAAVYAELGRLPLKYKRLYNIIKYWGKILHTESCILKTCYSSLYERAETFNEKNWAFNVKCILSRLGMSNIWSRQYLSKTDLIIVKQRISDQGQQYIFEKLSCSSKCEIYKHLINH